MLQSIPLGREHEHMHALMHVGREHEHMHALMHAGPHVHGHAPGTMACTTSHAAREMREREREREREIERDRERERESWEESWEERVSARVAQMKYWTPPAWVCAPNLGPFPSATGFSGAKINDLAQRPESTGSKNMFS
jgi:hypothetical protein